MLFASVFCVAAASASVIDDSAGIITDQNQVKERFDQTSEKTGWQMILYTTSRGITSNLNDYADLPIKSTNIMTPASPRAIPSTTSAMRKKPTNSSTTSKNAVGCTVSSALRQVWYSSL